MGSGGVGIFQNGSLLNKLKLCYIGIRNLTQMVDSCELGKSSYTVILP